MIAVIGSLGMLGQAVMDELKRRNIPCKGFDLPDVDITVPDTLRFIKDMRIVINCAGYTDVDRAEDEPEKAFMVNELGVSNVAELCSVHNVKLCHISTDYVFNGEKKFPYTEIDPVEPLNVYGKSKLGGELAVKKAGCSYLIVRTQALFGSGGRNFVDTIINKAADSNSTIEVVDDQYTSPTYTRDCASAILDLLEIDAEGIVNVSASGYCSWYELAREIIIILKLKVKLKAIKSFQLTRKAKRPSYAVLDKTLLKRLLGRELPLWNEGLKAYLKEKYLIGL